MYAIVGWVKESYLILSSKQMDNSLLTFENICPPIIICNNNFLLQLFLECLADTTECTGNGKCTQPETRGVLDHLYESKKATVSGSFTKGTKRKKVILRFSCSLKNF